MKYLGDYKVGRNTPGGPFVKNYIIYLKVTRTFNHLGVICSWVVSRPTLFGHTRNISDPTSCWQCYRLDVKPPGAGFLPDYPIHPLLLLSQQHSTASPDKIDDSSTSGELKILFYSAGGLGSACGFLAGAGFPSAYIDSPLVRPRSGLTRNSPLWLGAWWMGMLVCAAITSVAALPLELLPTRTAKGEKGIEDPPPASFRPPELACAMSCGTERCSHDSLHAQHVHASTTDAKMERVLKPYECSGALRFHTNQVGCMLENTHLDISESALPTSARSPAFLRRAASFPHYPQKVNPDC
ncbi:uncharacterized protein DEA37_0008518 [Paragonimus westermani]|uniref:Uncharacterized protein n=1 Tax=Paragonimus westermani TaxID=34504 RepID=A0A5J4NLV2_9TREM|nr:uncharacterized protein DEA37_0008518 [Paragonimus westermani]